MDGVNVFNLEGSVSLDTSGLEKSIQDAKKASQDLANNLKTNFAQFQTMQAQIDSLSKELSASRAEFDRMKAEIEKASKAADENADATSEMKSELDKAEKALDSAADSASDMGRATDKAGDGVDGLSDALDSEKTSADKAGEETDDYGKSAQKAADDTKKFEKEASGLSGTLDGLVAKLGVVAGAIGNGLLTAAKIGVGALTAAGVAVGGLTTKALSSYGEREQLVGGIETLFKDSAQKVQAYAAEAYKTAGLSANEYMDTAISFSGALLKSLGNDTARAAELTQTTITDMADQANKYGKTVEEVSATYTSLARGNYQTLDNLFGGMFKGTKEGLSEMLRYAENYRASMGDTVRYSEDSYADIVTAIHDISEETGVAGTTAKEAAGTIQGSAGSMKAAWEDLLEGFADPNADLSQLIDNFVQTAKKSFSNIFPTVKNALEGIGQFVEDIAPIISDQLPSIINDTLPGLLAATTSLVESFGTAIQGALPVVIKTAFSTLPELLETATNVSDSLFTALQRALTSIADNISNNNYRALFVNNAINLFSSIAEGLTRSLDVIIGMIPDVVSMIGSLISKAAPVLIRSIAEIISSLTYMLNQDSDTIFSVISDVLTSVIGALTDTLPDLIPEVVNTLLDVLYSLLSSDLLPNLLESVGELVTAVAEALIENQAELGDALTDLIDMLFTTIHDVVGPQLDELLITFLDVVGSTFADNAPAMFESFADLLLVLIQILFETLKTGFLALPELVFVDILGPVFEKIGEFFENVGAKIYDFKESLAEKLGEFLAKFVEFFENLGGKIFEFKESVAAKVSELVSSVRDKIVGMAESAKTWGKDLIENFVGGITENIHKVTSAVSGVADRVRDFIGFSEPKEGPLSMFHTFAPDMLELFAKGIRDNADEVYREIQALSSGISADINTDLSIGNAISSTEVPTISEAIIPTSNAAINTSDGGITVSIVNNWDGVRIDSDYDIAEIISDMSDRAVIAMSERLEQLRIFDTRAYGGVIVP